MTLTAFEFCYLFSLFGFVDREIPQMDAVLQGHQGGVQQSYRKPNGKISRSFFTTKQSLEMMPSISHKLTGTWSGAELSLVSMLLEKHRLLQAVNVKHEVDEGVIDEYHSFIKENDLLPVGEKMKQVGPNTRKTNI